MQSAGFLYLCNIKAGAHTGFIKLGGGGGAGPSLNTLHVGILLGNCNAQMQCTLVHCHNYQSGVYPDHNCELFTYNVGVMLGVSVQRVKHAVKKAKWR